MEDEIFEECEPDEDSEEEEEAEEMLPEGEEQEVEGEGDDTAGLKTPGEGLDFYLIFGLKCILEHFFKANVFAKHLNMSDFFVFFFQISLNKSELC